MEYYIGIDPDIRKVSVAVLDGNRQVHSIFLSKTPEVRGFDARDNLVMHCSILSQYFVNLRGMSSEDRFVLVVEGQRYVSGYGAGKTNPQDLIHLGQMSGFMVGNVMLSLNTKLDDPEISLKIPYPSEWKGSLKKAPHHRWVVRQLGLATKFESDVSGLVVPDIEESRITVSGKTRSGRDQKLNDGDWMDIMDSLGLALWGRAEGEKTRLKEKWLK